MPLRKTRRRKFPPARANFLSARGQQARRRQPRFHRRVPWLKSRRLKSRRLKSKPHRHLPPLPRPCRRLMPNSSSTTRNSTRRAPTSAASAENQAKLRREIEAIGDDRRALNQQLIDTAARVRDVEAQHRGDAAATQTARRPGSGSAQIARRTPQPRSSKSLPRSSASAISRRRRCWCSPKTRCKRCAPRSRSALCFRTCAAQADALAGDLADLLRAAQGYRRRKRPSRARSRHARARAVAHERVDRRTPEEAVFTEQALDAERHPRRRSGASGRQPQGSHRQARIEHSIRRRARACRGPLDRRGCHAARSRRAQGSRAGLRQRSPLPPRAGTCACRSMA